MSTGTARDRLVEAAVDSFAERGFAATTTRDIAARAGMSPAAVYVHYDSKESLLFSVSLSGHRQVLQVITTASASRADPIDRLHAVVHAFSLWHALNSRVSRIVQYEYHALTEDHRAQVSVHRRAIERVVQDVLVDGVASGALEVGDVPGTALSLLSLGVDLVRWFEPGGSRSGHELAALHARLAVRMTVHHSSSHPSSGRLTGTSSTRSTA